MVHLRPRFTPSLRRLQVRWSTRLWIPRLVQRARPALSTAAWARPAQWATLRRTLRALHVRKSPGITLARGGLPAGAFFATRHRSFALTSHLPQRPSL